MNKNTQNTGLPRFGSNLKKPDKHLPHVTPYINVHIFLRDLHNHFEANNIISNIQKLQILSGKLDAPIYYQSTKLLCGKGSVLGGC